MSIKNKITNLLENKHFEIAVIILIAVNIIVFVLQTDVNIETKLHKTFYIIETFSIIVFTIEYLLRIFTLNRFKDIFSFYMLIDLFAILPFYLSFIPINTVFLRLLRLFRIFRVLKLMRYANAIENIKKAFAKRNNELIITGIIFVLAIFLSSTFIYFAEHIQGQDTFKSIPSAFWWSIITVTTVGYGDAYPLTTIGRLIAGITAIFGVGLHGLLIGIISSAILDVIHKE